MKKPPHFLIVLIAMVLGALAGGIAQAALGAQHPGLQWFSKEVAQPAGQLFIRLIFMVVLPLLFSALVLGVAELGAAKKIGKIGGRALAYTVLLSGIAVALALAAVNGIGPGRGFPDELRADLMAQYGSNENVTKNLERAQEGKSFSQTLLGFIPENPVEEAAKPKLGGVLAIMVFSLFFGVALSAIEPDKAQPVKNVLEGVFAVSLKLIEYAMRLAPIGVFGFMFVASATFGVDLLLVLGKYALVVLGVLLLQLLGTYSLVLKFIAKRNPLEFFRSVKEVIVTAFATSSSNATLPVALRVTQDEVKIPRPIASFVLTCGATANQNGTALFEGITVLFLAQVFGVQLGIGEQLTVIGMCVLAGVGTAGVPGGAWPMIAAICSSIGVPPAAIALCFGIDRILDMSRTVVNVVGDVVIATCVASEADVAA